MKSNWLRHLALASAFAGTVFASVAAEQNLFVDANAPAGGDGSAARPFRSPVEARDAARKATRGAGFVTVRIRPGDYFLPDGLSLGPADSRLRFVGEKGVRFTRAEKATPGGVVKCAAARPPDYETYSRMAPHAPMFFYDGKWAVEARWPNEGWAEFTKDQVVDSGLRSGGLAGVPPDKPTEPGSFRFANDRPANWDFGAGVYLAGYTTHDWAFDRVRLESFTPSNRLVRLAAAVQYGLCGQTWSDHKGRRFYIYGAKSELDAPGEYYYDRKSGRVDFIAPQGMREFLAVTREGPIVSVRGASDVTFEGIAFEYACGDAVRLENATNVVVRDSAILNVGGNGVLLLGGRGCRVERTEIAHCGFCGTRIDAGDRRTLTRADHVIADCEIHDFSRICRTYQPAASVKGCGVTVRGCRIHDAPHSGVIYHGNEFLFEGNEVWDILGECGDAGAFYTGRDPTSRGNVLRGNYVHDVGHPEKGSTNTMGFYIDDCDAGETVVSNRIVNVPRGIMIGGGQDNHVIGNLIERCNLGLSLDARGVAWTEHWDSPTDKSWQMTRKVKELPVAEEPWKSRYPLLVNYLNEHPREPRHVSIVGNRFVDCKKTWEWGMGAEKYLEHVERRGNTDVRHAKNGVVWLDISEDVPRQTVIAEGGRTLPEGYQGHPTTVLTREGKLLCVWTFGHGGPCGPAAESTDGGRTWTRIDARFPAVYRETHKNCPTLQKCVRKDGGERLFVFSAKFKGDPNAPTNFFRLASMISDDGGRSWREGKVADLSSAMPPTGFMRLKDGMLALFGQVRLDAAVKTDGPKDDQGVWMSVSRDDGETWGPMRVVAAAKERNLCEPCCLRSPDGKTLALVMRENRHRDCSMMCFSSDEGQTWTAPALTAPELSGDRHEALALEGGRYLVCFRDRMIDAPTYGQYVGWVGSWDDLVHAKPGEMRIRLLNHHGKKGVWPGNEIDTGYSGVERLPDGTILCTTYTKHFPDDRHSSVVATRLYPLANDQDWALVFYLRARSRK